MNPETRHPYRASLHVFGIALSICTFLLLFAGGMVTSTNSGLSVPDWPTTFGQNMFLFPPSMMRGGIFYEHGHRLFASLVGLLTVINCAALWFMQKRRWLGWAGAFALLLVIAQGVLGGMTVRYKLPMPVSAAHACTAELFFGLTLLMAFATSRAWINAPSRDSRRASPEAALAIAFSLMVFLQILVGAVMRHSYAGLAIPTFPMAYGQWVPPFWSFGILVHFLHTRVGAGILVILGATLITAVMRSRRAPGAAKALAGLLAAALLGQCLLGMLTIWTGKAPVPTTIHLSMGAAVFAIGLLLLMTLLRLQASPAGRLQAHAKGGAINPESLSRNQNGMATT